MSLSARDSALLQGVEVDRQVGLEIGPLDKAVVRPAPGRRIFYADYTDRETLCTRSLHDPNVDTSAIPPVHYEIAALPERLDRRFDYIVASHVVEHVPDLLGWLRTVLGWLSPGGRLILAVPDKRYCFDLLRSTSTLGQVVQANLERRRKPGFAAVYDAMRAAVSMDIERAWREDPYRGPLTPLFTPEIAFYTAQCASESDDYVDCHAWVFTFPSFLQLMDELRSHSLLDHRVLRTAAPVYLSNEFHVVLAPG